MKELSVEDKAKRYNEALEMAGKELQSCGTQDCDAARQIFRLFPELKESEDEKIRKEILEYCHKRMNNEFPSITIHQVKRWLPWLEKQGEQKPADKVEPKFKVGDWITNGVGKCQIRFIDDTQYWYSENCILGSIESVDKRYHLWTIQDARDGDVICSNQIILIFKQWEHNSDCNFVIAHAGIDISGKLQITDGHWLINNESKLATKEQCALLFQQMKEKGYEWDAEKKELKKIEQRSYQWNISDFRTWQHIVSDVLTKHDGIGQYLDDGLCKKIAQDMQEEWSKKLCSVQQPAAWSEEDEKRLQSCLKILQAKGLMGVTETINTNWLKSLKDRVQPKPNQE